MEVLEEGTEMIRTVNVMVELPSQFRKRQFKVNVEAVKRFAPDKFAGELAKIRSSRETAGSPTPAPRDSDTEEDVETFLEKREEQTGKKTAVLLEDE